MNIFKARYIPITYQAKRCCAPGCGDKIKKGANDKMIEVFDFYGPDQHGYLEIWCREWFECGHPDYGCVHGKLEFID